MSNVAILMVDSPGKCVHQINNQNDYRRIKNEFEPQGRRKCARHHGADKKLEITSD